MAGRSNVNGASFHWGWGVSSSSTLPPLKKCRVAKPVPSVSIGKERAAIEGTAAIGHATQCGTGQQRCAEGIVAFCGGSLERMNEILPPRAGAKSITAAHTAMTSNLETIMICSCE